MFTVAGSRSYGINLPDSDVDVKGICIPPLVEYRLGILDKFEQADSPEHLAAFFTDLNEEEQVATVKDCLSRGRDILAPDGVIYDINKFFFLALNANPNILETLFCAPEDIRIMTDIGEELRNNRDLFLSKKATYSYRGYAFAQMKKIKSHRSWLLDPPTKAPKRSDFGLPEHESTLSSDEQNAFLWVLTEILKDKLGSFKLSRSTKEELETLDLYGCISSGIPDNVWPTIKDISGAPTEFIQVMQAERAYRNARSYWRSYLNWKDNRNPKRALLEKNCGYDSKHAGHLTRLMIQGKEIIKDHALTVRLSEENKALVMNIRKGLVKFDEVEKWFNSAEKELDKLTEESDLRKEPNRPKANDLLVELQLKHSYQLGRK